MSHCSHCDMGCEEINKMEEGLRYQIAEKESQLASMKEDLKVAHKTLIELNNICTGGLPYKGAKFVLEALARLQKYG